MKEIAVILLIAAMRYLATKTTAWAALSAGVPIFAAIKLPDSALPYMDTIYSAEDTNDLPRGLVARVAWQESRFRDDIITGKTVSPAGAIGLMQIVPKHHPGVNPYDPIASIKYAAKFLADLYDQFGEWDKALAAYNWGPGNVKEFGLAKAPTETRRYYSQITQDMGIV